MVKGKEDNPLNIDLIEKWLENYFLDPLTAQLDETAFHVDLFETDDEFIIEALLDEYNNCEVSVLLKEDQIMIQVGKNNTKSDRVMKTRSIPFPFPVAEHKVSATFQSGILEILISKTHLCKGKNRLVPFTK